MNNKIIRAVTVSLSVDFFTPIIKDLQEQGYEVACVSSPGPELQKLRKLGVNAIEVPMERRMSPFKDLKSLFRLIRVFRREKPMMVHSMTPKAGLLCMMAAWITRVPVRVHTFTGLVWPTATGLSRKILMFTDWLTCACATHVNPEGVGVMNDLKQVTNKSMRVLGYGNVRGVDMYKFSRRTEVLSQAVVLRKEDVFTFIFVGRLVGDKGINELVFAFDKLHKEYKNIRLILVGNKESEIDPLAAATEQTMQHNPAIEEVGPMFGDKLLAYYAASDCFVFPSYREGFPNVVLEAGAMGLPSIVTDINGSREIIKSGENGLIIPSKDKDALYHAMKEVILNRKQTEYWATNARPMIEFRFEQSYVQHCLYDFYEEILKNI